MAAGTSGVYKVFSGDIMAAMLVEKKIETLAMLEKGKILLGIELHFHANSSFCVSKPM